MAISFYERPDWITYAKAVQLPCCCNLDHKILFMALGIIHAIATKAPNKLNSKSVTVAIATPTETTARAKTCTNIGLFENLHMKGGKKLLFLSLKFAWSFYFFVIQC